MENIKIGLKVDGGELQAFLGREHFLKVQCLSTAKAIASVSELDIFHFNIRNYGRA